MSDVIHRDDVKRLNLIRTAGTFVIREIGSVGEGHVHAPEYVPNDHGIYWIGGLSILSSGREVDSVFRVDTDSGGTLVSVFWWLEGRWFAQDDPEVLATLGLARDQIFPFDWRFSVPLEKDIFHDEADQQ